MNRPAVESTVLVVGSIAVASPCTKCTSWLSSVGATGNVMSSAVRSPKGSQISEGLNRKWSDALTTVTSASRSSSCLRPLRYEQLLARQSRNGLALSDALRAFAVEADDPAADLLAAALITAATNETRDLGRVLAALVEATRAQVQMRESVDAGRAQVRSATRLVMAVTAAFTLALLLFSRDYLAPYGTVEGQLWLAVAGGVFAMSLALLLRLDRIDVPAAPLMTEASASETAQPTAGWSDA